MGLIHLIKITTFGWFIIILVGFFGTLIITVLILAVKQLIVEGYIKNLLPNRKYYFWEIDSKIVRRYIELSSSYEKNEDEYGRYFIKLICRYCGSENVTFIEFIKDSVHYVCNRCHEIFLNEMR
jgi:hypothetical protein